MTTSRLGPRFRLSDHDPSPSETRSPRWTNRRHTRVWGAGHRTTDMRHRVRYRHPSVPGSTFFCLRRLIKSLRSTSKGCQDPTRRHPSGRPVFHRGSETQCARRTSSRRYSPVLSRGTGRGSCSALLLPLGTSTIRSFERYHCRPVATTSHSD